MRLFEEPKLNVVMFAVEDIVTTSGATEGEPEYTFFPEPCI